MALPLLFFDFYPVVSAGKTVADMYYEATVWLPFMGEILIYGVLGFLLTLIIGRRLRVKTSVFAIISATILSTIVLGFAIQSTPTHLSDVFLFRLMQMIVLLLGSNIGLIVVKLFYRFFNEKKSSTLDRLLQRIPFRHQLFLLTLTYIAILDLYAIRSLIWFPSVIYYGYWIKKNAEKFELNKSNTFERIYTVFIALLLVIQLIILPFQIGEIVCNIPILNEQFNCQPHYIWD